MHVTSRLQASTEPHSVLMHLLDLDSLALGFQTVIKNECITRPPFCSRMVLFSSPAPIQTRMSLSVNGPRTTLLRNGTHCGTVKLDPNLAGSRNLSLTCVLCTGVANWANLLAIPGWRHVESYLYTYELVFRPWQYEGCPYSYWLLHTLRESITRSASRLSLRWLLPDELRTTISGAVDFIYPEL